MIKVLALSIHAPYIGILLLLLVSSSKILAQSLPKDVAMYLNPTRYDSLSLPIDSMQLLISNQQTRIDSVLKQSTLSTDSVFQSIDTRTSDLDSLVQDKKTVLKKAYSYADTLLPKPIIIPKLPSQGIVLPPLKQQMPLQQAERINTTLPGLPKLPGRSTSDQYTKDIKDIYFLKAESIKDELDSKEALPKSLQENASFQQGKAYLNSVNTDSLDAQGLRDTLLSTAASKGESKATQYVKEQLSEELPKPLMAEHPTQDAMRDKLTHEAQDFFAANTTQLETAQKQLTSLKQKYSKLQQQDSVFVKANSLEDVPIGQRITYGFNLHPDRRTWSSLTAAPFVGYHLSKTWVVGASVLFNASWQTEPWKINSALTGSNVFLQYYLPKDFFTQIEFALEKQSFQKNDIVEEHWQKKLYLGAGKQVNFTKKLALQALFMFSVLPDHFYVPQQRWQVRIGIRRNAY
jgi:hypothetical protein